MPRREPSISREKLFEKLGYTPHSKTQWDAHRASQRFRVACCGRRYGKSTWAGHELTYKMFVPDSINWIVGPDYGLGEKEFRVAWNDFAKLNLLGRCSKSYSVKQGNMRLYFKDLNSLLEVKSAERPVSLVGEGLDHVCMSEAAKHKLSTWQMYIEPALSDKRGSADFPSTPQGFNWYKGLYDVGILHDYEHEDYIGWRFPTWENKTIFPEGYSRDCESKEHPRSSCKCNKELVRIWRKVSPMYWLQEYCAEFTAFEGMIYPDFNEMLHVRQFDYNPKFKNWLSLDFGYVDPFVALDIMIDPSDRVWVWDEYMVSYMSTHEHGIALTNRKRDYAPGYHIDAISADPRGADEIATLAWQLGSITANNVDRQIGYESIRRALKVREDGLPGLIIHPRCTELIRQMKTLRVKSGKDDHNSKEVQHDYDDHGPDALRYFFNEYFILGRNEGLADLYSGIGSGTEAETFFTYTSGIALDDRI